MEISKYNSRKISILNAVAMMLVLLLHSYFKEAEFFPLALNVQRFMGTTGVAGVAVPLFFFISGLLFFKSVNRVRDCVCGIRKRVKSLLIPYAIWNIIFVGWFVFMNYIPGLSRYVNSDILAHLSLSDPIECFRFLFIEPAGFHLWFLRDLFLFVCLTPIIYIACKKIPVLFFLSVLLLCGFIPRCGIAYFVGGALIALGGGMDVFSEKINRPVFMTSLFVFCANCIMNTIPSCCSVVENSFFQQFANFAGIILVWKLYDYISTGFTGGRMSEALLLISKYSFFIYLFHEPALNVIKKLGLTIIENNSFNIILLYFISPLIMALLALTVAALLKKCTPKLYSIVVGGR